MDDLTLARALHVLAIVHWIGGVTMVTLVLLPTLMHVPADQRFDLFEAIERRFARQARISTLVAGGSGFYMTYRLAAWDRFLDPAFWWMHAMVFVWVIFSCLLFIAEPTFVHRWFRERAKRNPDATCHLLWRVHLILLALTFVAVAAGVLGAHGALN